MCQGVWPWRLQMFASDQPPDREIWETGHETVDIVKKGVEKADGSAMLNYINSLSLPPSAFSSAN